MTVRKELKVIFQPSGRKVHVLPGTRILEAAARAGIMLRNPCGGAGTCGKCRVRIERGACAATPACAAVFSPAEVAQGWRLACQCAVAADTVVEVPAESLFESEAQILITDTGARVQGTPALRKRRIELTPPDLAHPHADLERLCAALGPADISLAQLALLPDQLRATAFRGTAVLCDGHLLDWEPDDTTGEAWAVAFDLGTTTVVGTLINTVDGSEHAVAATMNPQISVGDDVISRIAAARESRDNIRRMQESVVHALNGLITRLCREAHVPRERIYEVSLAGNTTMQHLFCGINPAALGEIPFVPAYRAARRVAAQDVGLHIHPAGRLFVFPNIGGFVGGDTVAGILANGVQHAPETLLFVDIGTNGEIVLAHQGRLRATSCAAGPAFEGARITAGMRAAEGAVDKVVFDGDDLVCNVIGGCRMAGICGTALIDAAAVLLELGVLDPTGRLLSAAEAPARVTPAVRRRLHPDGNDTKVLLGTAAEARSGEPVYLFQRDLRELQLAAGAIRAAIALLLRQAGLQPQDLHGVLLAGGFGNFIRRENACRMGLLPALPMERIRFVGNASSMGAKAVLLSHELRAEADRIAATTEHVDLSLDPEFQMEFGMAMMFPEATAG
jgi:uncharacterized 2Fe-2S/4Fe-4S cluster protein (DUF4445 family)